MSAAHHWAKPKIKGVLGCAPRLQHPFAPDKRNAGAGDKTNLHQISRSPGAASGNFGLASITDHFPAQIA